MHITKTSTGFSFIKGILPTLILSVAAIEMSGTGAQAEEPKLFWGSDPIHGGETAMLYGDGIVTNATAEAWRMDDDPVSGPPNSVVPWQPKAPGKALEVLQTSGQCLKAVLPSDFQPGLYAVQIKTTNGNSQPWFLNRAEACWWLGGEDHKAYAGEEIRVFGKNFGEKTRAWLSVSGGPATELKMVESGKYALRCQVPADLTPGAYSLRIHNGHGGTAGFGEPLTIPVVKRVPWPSTVYNAREFGAKGDGAADDTWAILAALAASEKNGGGVVYLPRGNYRITGKLIIPAKTVFKGESRETTGLMMPWDAQVDLDSVIAGNGDFAVEDLTVTAAMARRMISAPLRPANDNGVNFSESTHNLSEGDMGRNVHLRRLCLRHLRQSIGLGSISSLPHGWAVGFIGHDFGMSDCDIVSSDQALCVAGTRLIIERNRIASATRFQDCEEVVWAHNTIRDCNMDNTGNCIEGRGYRMHIEGNTIEDIYGWDREAITFDAPYGHNWLGQISMTNPTVMTVAKGNTDVWGKKWTPGAFKGLGAMIVSGKGLGQFIPIIGNDETSFTLERPWVIPPDQSSWVAVRQLRCQVVLQDNRIRDAGEAIQLYATTYGFILDGNSSVRAGGMPGFSRDYMRGGTRRAYSSCAFNQWLNNTLGEGQVYSRGYALGGGHLGPSSTDSNLTNPATVTTMGNVVRNNTVSGDITVGAGRGVKPDPRPRIINARDTVIEGNRISDTPGSGTNVSRGGLQGLVVSSSFEDTLLRNNAVASCPLPFRDDGINTRIDPRSRLGYQIESAACVLGEFPALKGIRERAAALAGKPDNEELQATCGRLHDELWAAVAGQSPKVPSDLLFSLSGLRFTVASSLAMVPGENGVKAKVDVKVRTAPWSPTLQVIASTEAGAFGQAPLGLKPDILQTLHCFGSLPSSASSVPLRLTATLGGVSLCVEEQVPFNRLEIRDWLAAGSGTATGWSPCLSNGDRDLGKKLGAASSATLAAGIDAAEPVSAVLELSCPSGEADLFLNDRPIAQLSQKVLGGTTHLQKTKSVRVTLDKGANLLLCRTRSGGASAGTNTWTIQATLLTDPEPKRFVRIAKLNAQEILKLPGLRQGEARAATASVLELDHLSNAAGVPPEWTFKDANHLPLEVVESGDAARGRVLLQRIAAIWDHFPSRLYREIKPGSLSPDSAVGIRVCLKNDQPITADVTLVAGNKPFTAKVGVGPEWREYRIPLERFVDATPARAPITAEDLSRVNRIEVNPCGEDIMNLMTMNFFIDGLGILRPADPAQKPPSTPLK